MKEDDKLHWYVAYTRAHQERKVGEYLKSCGVEFYIAIQKEKHKWSDRYKIVDRLVIPRVVFIHTTAANRLMPLQRYPGLFRYLTTQGPYTPVVVRDREMELFRMMVDRSVTPVELTEAPLRPGMKIRVKSGPLAGLEAELIELNSRHKAIVRLGTLGAASAEIATEDIEPIKTD